MEGSSFTLRQKILHHVILHSFDEKAKGLLVGRMGMVVALYLVGRESGKIACLNLADRILETIVEHLDKGQSFCFSSGLCGIGWGIDFLLHEHFIDGNPEEICENLNATIMQVNPEKLDYSLAYGLEGLLHYVLAHISSCGKMPFDYSFLKSLYKAVEKVPLISVSRGLYQLCDSYRCVYEGRSQKYQFSITDFIHSSCRNITECNYMQQDLSLASGLCGSLLLL